MEGEKNATAEGAEAWPPSQLGQEGPPTPSSEPEVVPRDEHVESRLSWYEQDQAEREAERATVGFVEAIFLRAADRIEAMEAKRHEIALMRERAAEAALRRLHDPIVIQDETPPTSDMEIEGAEDELELYLLGGTDDEEPMEAEARPPQQAVRRRMRRAWRWAAHCCLTRQLLARRHRTPPLRCQRCASIRPGHRECGLMRTRTGIRTSGTMSRPSHGKSASCQWSSVGVMRRCA